MKPNDQRTNGLEALPPLEPELRELLDAALRRDMEDPADEAGREELLARVELAAHGMKDAREPSRRFSWLLRPVGTAVSICLLATFAIGLALREGASGGPTVMAPSVSAPRSQDSPVQTAPGEAREDRPTLTRVDALPSSAELGTAGTSTPAPPAYTSLPNARALAPPAHSPAVAPSSTRPAAAAAPSGGLAEEIRLIEAARARMTAHDEAAALRLVSEHERRFPNGQLTQQREWIRIQALVATGAAADARKRTEQFRERFPGGLLLPSVERGLDPAGP